MQDKDFTIRSLIAVAVVRGKAEREFVGWTVKNLTFKPLIRVVSLIMDSVIDLSLSKKNKKKNNRIVIHKHLWARNNMLWRVSEIFDHSKEWFGSANRILNSTGEIGGSCSIA